MAGGSMMAQIVMRKCDVTYKKAKQIVKEARDNLWIEDEAMIWSKELQAECFRLVEVDKDKTRKEKEAARALFEEDLQIKPILVNSRRLSGHDFDDLFGPSPPEPRARPTVERQRSKSLTLPSTSRRHSEPYRNEDCLSVSSDEIRQRFARTKSEMRRKQKKQPILHEHLDGNSNHGATTTTTSVANQTDCAVVGSPSVADDTNYGVVAGASATPFSIKSRKENYDDDSSDSDSDQDNDGGDDDAFVKRKSHKTKELMMQQQRGRSKSIRKVSKDEQHDDDDVDEDDGAFVVRKKSTSLKSGELKEMADAVRRRTLNARDRSRSRSRVNRRSGNQQQDRRGSALGGHLDCDEVEEDTENSDITDLTELDNMVNQFAETIKEKDSSAVATSNDTGKKEKKRQPSVTRHVVSKEDFEAACQHTDNPAELIKSLRRVSATKQRRASGSTAPRRVSVSSNRDYQDEDPLALTASPRRTQRHIRRNSSPTKKKKTKAPKPPSLDPSHINGRAETSSPESKLVTLQELEDDDLNESHSSMKSTASKTCMVPVLRSPTANSPIRSTSTSSPTRSRNSPTKLPNKSASAYVLSPRKGDSPPTKTLSPIVRKSKGTSRVLKAAPALDFGNADDDDPFGSPNHDFDNDSGTSRTVSTNGSASESSDFASKQKHFSNTSPTAGKHTNSHNDDARQQHTSPRPKMQRVPSTRQLPLRKQGLSRQASSDSLKVEVKAKHHRTKAMTKDRSSLKLARKARQSDLFT